MVTFDQVQTYMKSQASEDKASKHVQATGATLEEALQQASIELGLAVKKMDYEVLEKGTKGTFGFGKKPWLIIAYPAKQKVEEKEFDQGLDMDFGKEEAAQSEDRDGAVSVRLTPEGVLLKVSKPIGKGRTVTERDAIEKISRRFTGRYDTGLVAKVVKLADDEYVTIADYEHTPSNDPMLSVDVTEGEMKAVLLLHPPGSGGADPTFDAVVSFLQNNGVVNGIKEDAVKAIEEDPPYGSSVVVAEGGKMKNGNDAYVMYTFETDKSNVKLKEKNGKVDFKELNLIQNVVEGQVLARKVPAERGESGRTVTGKLLPAKDGMDCNLEVGKNVRLSEDGNSVIAEINGQVVITGDKVNVEPVLTVPGDVNLKTGNILFLGTVLVEGSVEDGFSIKAAGNIEVRGSVGRCDLDAEGDIIVHQGMSSKNGGKIVCGHSVWSKFIENSSVEAGELVVVSDGIINSQIVATKKVICKGKRASIVGGHVLAAEEINAKTLGSVAGSETILEVGYDPKSKQTFDQLESKRVELEKDQDEVDLNLGSLENLKKVKKTLPEEKQKYFDELIARKKDILSDLSEVKKELDNLKTYLSQLKINGKICASTTVFPGVKIFIKDALLEVKSEFKAVTFLAEGNLVKVTKYEEPDEDFSRKP